MIPEYKTAAASDSFTWFGNGWKLFKKNIMVWVVLQLIFGMLAVISGFVPFLGVLAFSLFAPVLMGGMFNAAQKCDRSETIEIGDLFSAFRESELMKRLLIVGVVGLLVTTVSMIIGGMAIGGMMVGTQDAAAGAASGGILFLFISLLVSAFWAMATIFGIPLVVFSGAQPFPALKSSVRASLSNWLPLTVIGLVSMMLFFIGSIPMGLGLLIVFPFLICTVYCAFIDIYSFQSESMQLQV